MKSFAFVCIVVALALALIASGLLIHWLRHPKPKPVTEDIPTHVATPEELSGVGYSTPTISIDSGVNVTLYDNGAIVMGADGELVCSIPLKEKNLKLEPGKTWKQCAEAEMKAMHGYYEAERAMESH
jgi:hypothetical protein